MIDARNFYINGSWVAPQAQADCSVIDPSTEEVYATISLGDQADTDAAVAAAKAALPMWRATKKDDRIAILRKILDVYNCRSAEMGAAMSKEMGAPLDLSNGIQTGIGAMHIQAFIDALDGFAFERQLRDDAPNDQIIYEPIGVCALITPWNWPMNQVTLKVIPALAAGCTMVLKPSEEAPMSSLLFAEILDEAGVPAGVFNIVNGTGVGVGTQLSGHPDVDFVSFTGSTRAGVAISKNAADTVKRVSLELGGKGANIIFADADADAVQRGAIHCFNNTGQSCNAPTRMLVERSRYDAAVKEAIATAEAQAVDTASKTGDHIGPMINQTQFDKVQSMIEVGIKEGAKLVAGGTGRPQGLNRGYFVRPTVFADCTNDMDVMRQEIFGPVLCISPFDSEEDAIEVANDTPYGLTNYVQTTDPERANRVARALKSGMVEMNGNFRSAGAPFGGFKQSGTGREGGVWGLEEYLEVKAVGGWFRDV
ncbi:3-succinoylsemialdehyde-pyridine dehydrogenase [Roseovarius albus]|uniref:aldehyde dehydrogenase (NAD(+)) n=1 Tax=Roseovarius albus TaxID=1247867 RepID=A0A1X6ZUQ6_9RHOB|nr:aldehyde dehydrogenase family protein [Roseovarius albus]SLN62074.1 3-succinoylsemialdehyde-pyridine dehydrogenase [Roseovarius albus]